VINTGFNKTVTFDEKLLTLASEIVKNHFGGKWSQYVNLLVEEDLKKRRMIR